MSLDVGDNGFQQDNEFTSHGLTLLLLQQITEHRHIKDAGNSRHIIEATLKGQSTKYHDAAVVRLDDAVDFPRGLSGQRHCLPRNIFGLLIHRANDGVHVQRNVAIDADLRLDVGLSAGGKVIDGPDGRMVRRARCPACARPSVWYGVEKGRARCDHVQSCGYGQPDGVRLIEYADAVGFYGGGR